MFKRNDNAHGQLVRQVDHVLPQRLTFLIRPARELSSPALEALRVKYAEAVSLLNFRESFFEPPPLGGVPDEGGHDHRWCWPVGVRFVKIGRENHE